MGWVDEDGLQKRQKRNAAILHQRDERRRRLLVASEARAAGHGGIAAVSRVARIAASTIGRGLKELDAPAPRKPGGVRRPGGGRKSLMETDPGLLDDLNALVEPDTARRSDIAALAERARAYAGWRLNATNSGAKISHRGVGELLEEAEVQPASQPQDARAPTIPTATRNSTSSTTRSGRPWPRTSRLYPSMRTRRTGRRFQERRPRAAQARRPGRSAGARFPDQGARAAPAPYGICDLAANAGFRQRPSRFRRSADGGGSNGSRVRLWKLELQRRADELGISMKSIIRRREPANGTRSSIACSGS